MPVATSRIQIHTQGFGDIHDITQRAVQAVQKSNLQEGLLCCFVPGSTAGVTTLEFEPGLIQDLRRALETLAPQNARYEHNERWGDGNGFSHVRAALLGPSQSIPFSSGHLMLGTWQQLVLIDFDNRPRSREVIFQVVGE